jgi:hypothetical protein
MWEGGGGEGGRGNTARVHRIGLALVTRQNLRGMVLFIYELKNSSPGAYMGLPHRATALGLQLQLRPL